jgi:hypothetical protein
VRRTKILEANPSDPSMASLSILHFDYGKGGWMLTRVYSDQKP